FLPLGHPQFWRLINLNLLSLLVAFSIAYLKYCTTAFYPLSPTSCSSNTDFLQLSAFFEDWNPFSPADFAFGAKLWSEPKNLFGSNAFFFHGPNDKISTHGLLTVLAESLATSLPTRFVCLVPRQELLPSHFLELAVLHAGLPLFGFHGDERCLSNCSMSLILAANKESLQVDPINWERFVNRLHEWGSSDLISIPELTDTLFRERVSLLHSPRPLSKHPESVVLNSTPLINFY